MKSVTSSCVIKFLARKRLCRIRRSWPKSGRSAVILLQVLVCCDLFLALNAQKVTYYEHYKRQGKKVLTLAAWNLEIRPTFLNFSLPCPSSPGKSLEMVVHSLKCTPLPRKWREMTSSVDSHGSCLVFYEFPDCSGRHMTLRPGTATYVSNLKKIRFNDVISSAKACTPAVTRKQSRFIFAGAAVN